MTLTLRGLTTELKHYFTRIAGLFENYLQVKFKDPNLEVVCLCCMQTLRVYANLLRDMPLMNTMIQDQNISIIVINLQGLAKGIAIWLLCVFVFFLFIQFCIIFQTNLQLLCWVPLYGSVFFSGFYPILIGSFYFLPFLCQCKVQCFAGFSKTLFKLFNLSLTLLDADFICCCWCSRYRWSQEQSGWSSQTSLIKLYCGARVTISWHTTLFFP